jgi:hypothetical protein
VVAGWFWLLGYAALPVVCQVFLGFFLAQWALHFGLPAGRLGGWAAGRLEAHLIGVLVQGRLAVG